MFIKQSRRLNYKVSSYSYKELIQDNALKWFCSIFHANISYAKEVLNSIFEPWNKSWHAILKGNRDSGRDYFINRQYLILEGIGDLCVFEFV